MSKKLLFGAIASVLSINAFAVSSTVTSQDYVDAKDALKQDIIETGLVGIENNASLLPALVSYDLESNVVGDKYGILTQAIVDSWEESGPECESMLCNDVENYDNAIPTAQAVVGGFNRLYNDMISYTQQKMTCAGWPDGVAHTDANCWLWYKN